MKPPSLNLPQALIHEADHALIQALPGTGRRLRVITRSWRASRARIGSLASAAAVLMGLVGAVTQASPALAQYKWIDAQGGVHYSDLPPPRTAQGPVRFAVPGGMPAAAQTSGSPGAAEVQATKPEPDALSLQGLPGALARLARQAPVVLYGIAACSPCDEGRALLQARGIPYTERRDHTFPGHHAMLSPGLPQIGFPGLNACILRVCGSQYRI